MENLIKHIVNSYNSGEIKKEFTRDTLKIIKDIDSKKNKDIAVIGMSVKTAEADNVNEFWDLIIKGRDCIHDFPNERRQDVTEFLNSIYEGEGNYKFFQGGFLSNISGFDNKFFKCTPAEAKLMDPNQRIFLETSWEALEDSGYLNDDIYGSNVGVFLAYTPSIKDNYQQLIKMSDKKNIPTSIPLNLSAIVPSRISYLLDLKGPALCVDSACSSGILSLHLACKAIQNNECNMAIAGGIKLHLLPVDDPDYKLGIESDDYHTRAFDAKSDGTGLGEGCIALVLKDLDSAIKDKDNIYAVVKGSATNQDGVSLGITAPNYLAQKDVIVKAWKDAGVDPNTISYIETHGTGTPLGDPIEIRGITEAFREYSSKKQFCAITSLKSNIGHLYEAAGIAGAAKAILSLKIMLSLRL